MKLDCPDLDVPNTQQSELKHSLAISISCLSFVLEVIYTNSPSRISVTAINMVISMVINMAINTVEWQEQNLPNSHLQSRSTITWRTMPLVPSTAKEQDQVYPLPILSRFFCHWFHSLATTAASERRPQDKDLRKRNSDHQPRAIANDLISLDPIPKPHPDPSHHPKEMFRECKPR